MSHRGQFNDLAADLIVTAGDGYEAFNNQRLGDDTPNSVS